MERLINQRKAVFQKGREILKGGKERGERGERDRDRDRDRERERERERDVEREKQRRRERERERNERSERYERYDKNEGVSEMGEKRRRKSRSRSKEKRRERSGIFMNQREVDNLKNAYLGMNKEKKKILKPSEKFKNIFNFEWDPSEDTSQDINPIYAKKHEPQLLFGRGFRGGVDIKEQKKRYDQDNEKEKSGKVVFQQDVKRRREEDDTIHWSKKRIEEMTGRDWRIFREDNDVVIKGGRVPNPIRSWNESNLPNYLLDAIKKSNYKKPMQIQIQAIPMGLLRMDIIGVAPTGSGKSCAFLVPLIHYLHNLPPIEQSNMQDGPYALIMTPTRELAIQINEEFIKLACYTKLTSAVVVGGRNAEEQSFSLSRGVYLIVGTPGRLLDCLEKRFTVLNQCNFVILDEADKMIEMGLEETVNQILDTIPSTNLKSEREEILEQQEREMREGKKIYRITQMFSATMPSSVEKLAKKYLRCPVLVSIGIPGSGKKEIEQRIELMAQSNKRSKLMELLESGRPPIMIFVNKKSDADALYKFIDKMAKFKCSTLHGGKSQDKRERALNNFKDGTIDVLVCTNLGARGIDVEGITHVINYDAPSSILDYTHRIGRTGRAGKTGLATTFLTAMDEELFYDLRNFLIDTNQHVPPDLNSHPASKVKPGASENLARRKQVLYSA